MQIVSQGRVRMPYKHRSQPGSSGNTVPAKWAQDQDARGKRCRSCILRYLIAGTSAACVEMLACETAHEALHDPVMLRSATRWRLYHVR